MDCLNGLKWDIILASIGERLNFYTLVKTLRRCLDAVYSQTVDNLEKLSTEALSQFLAPLSPQLIQLNRRVGAVKSLSRPFLSLLPFVFVSCQGAFHGKEVLS